jgi:hypothetical protein
VTATVAERTAANRRLLADFFDSLDETQLDGPSLRAEWRVREVLAHLVMPLAVGFEGSSCRQCGSAAPWIGVDSSGA